MVKGCLNHINFQLEQCTHKLFVLAQMQRSHIHNTYLRLSNLTSGIRHVVYTVHIMHIYCHCIKYGVPFVCLKTFMQDINFI